MMTQSEKVQRIAEILLHRLPELNRLKAINIAYEIVEMLDE